jgi:hypothetical protein
MKKDKAAHERKTKIRALSALSDEDIDTNDISEVMDWRGAGKVYRPVKKSIGIRGE